MNSINKKMKMLGWVVALALCARSLPAQNAAKVIGIVKDEKGKALADASIVIRGQKTAEKRITTTAADGTFSASQLPPDTYQISAILPTGSDATAVVDLAAGQERNVSMTINTTSSASSVALDNTSATIELGSARLGTNVTANETASLPVNGRTFGPLALAAPFVANGGSADVHDLRFAGQSIEQTRYETDGVDSSSVVAAYPGFLPVEGREFRLGLSVENVQEFRINAAAYPADQGGGTGGQVSLASKSGGSDWHGALFEYFRNDAIAARNFFDGAAPNKLRMNQYGANAGGAIKKDKLFVFGSFEQLRQRVGSNVIELVPSAGERAGASPAAVPWLAAVPTGYTHTSDPDVDHSLRSAVAQQDEGVYTGRLDYVQTETSRFMLRYSKSTGTLLAPDTTTTPRNLNGSAHPDQAIATWSKVIANDYINLLTLGLHRSPSRISSSSGVNGFAGELVTIGTDGGFASPGGLVQLFDGTYGRAAEYRGRSYNASDAIDFTRGAHSIRAGVGLRVIRAPFSVLGGIQYAFRDPESFLANEDADVSYVGDLPFRHPEQEQYSAFVIDQWRLRPNLMLNLGLRYEFATATREANDQATLLNPFTLTSQPAHGGFYNPSKNGFQPRIALSWAPDRWKEKTVLRIGASVQQGFASMLSSFTPILETAPSLFLRGSTLGQTFASISNDPDVQRAPEALDLSSFGLPQRNYVFTASIQQALFYKFVGQAAFLGIESRHLTEGGVSNTSLGVNPQTGDVLRPYPTFTAVPFLTNGANSSYHAMELGLSRRLVDDFTVSSSFTWAHSIGDSLGAGDDQAPQNPACMACERADNNFDIREAASVSVIYDLPFGVNRPHLATGLGSKLLGGWSLGGVWNGRSGLPINVTIDRSNEIYYSASQRRFYSASADLPPDAIATVNVPGGGEDRPTLRPNAVAGVNPYLQQSPGWVNPAAFSIPLPGTFGDLGRNALRGPGLSQVDLQITRSFHVKERVTLKVRAEAFNLFNHTNFANPTSLLPDSLLDAQPGSAYSSKLAAGFGQLTSTVGQTVGLGTSRQFQMGMRVEF